MTNPLLQKYEEIYKPKPKVEEPKPEPKPSYPQENRMAIYNLELLLEDLKTGRAIYQGHKIEPNHTCLPPMIPLDYSQPYISPRYLSVYEGNLFTFKIFRRYR